MYKTLYTVCTLILWATVLSSSACTRLENPGRPGTSSSRLPVRAWWTKSSTAIDDLKRAHEFGVNTIIIQHDGHGIEWNTVIDGLAAYDFSAEHRRTSEHRDHVEALRHHYRAILSEAKAQGIRSYIMCPEIDLPTGFADPSYDNERMWSLVHNRLREVFQALPDLSGYMLYLTETEYEVFELAGSEAAPSRRARRLIETVWNACRAEHRKLLVTTFIHHPERLDAIAAALRGVAPHPDLAVVQYCCPNDWGLYAVLNPAIGHVGSHPEILGFDYAGENWGQGAHPFVQIEFMTQRLCQARERSHTISGLAGYVAWYGRSALGTLNEANVYAGAALAADPTRNGQEILQQWCEQRFGSPGAKVAAECLGRTQAVVFKTQHLRGYWLDTLNKSGLPTLAELDEYFIGDYFGEALGKWDAAYLPTWERIQSPDEAFLAEILSEKEEANRLCQQSLQRIRSARDLFRPEDFVMLERAFTFQELWSRIWRELTHIFFVRQIAKDQGWTQQSRATVERLLDTMSSEADELEARFGKDVFPRGPERVRQFVRDVRRKLQ